MKGVERWHALGGCAAGAEWRHYVQRSLAVQGMR